MKIIHFCVQYTLRKKDLKSVKKIFFLALNKKTIVFDFIWQGRYWQLFDKIEITYTLTQSFPSICIELAAIKE